MEVHDAEEAIGMRKMLAHDIRMRKNPHKGGHFLTFYGFSWSYAGSEFKYFPSKHFLFSKTSSRRLPRSVCKTSCNYVFKTYSRRLGRQKNITLKTSSRLLQDVFSTSWPRLMFAGLYWLNFFKKRFGLSVKAGMRNWGTK